jgi:hypothetical protein
LHNNTIFYSGLQYDEEEFEDAKGRQSESVYRRRTDNTMAKKIVQKGKQRLTKQN